MAEKAIKGKDRAHLLVIDIECTCWSRDEQPPDERQEIIEIGIGLIDPRTGAWERTPKSYPIFPYHSTVSDYCTALTGWTTATLPDCMHTFDAVLPQIVEEWHPERYPWASWGDFDRAVFQIECAFWRETYPFGRCHFDLSQLFALMRGTRKRGVAKAHKILGLDLVPPHHRADSDVRSIGQIVPFLFNRDWGL